VHRLTAADLLLFFVQPLILSLSKDHPELVEGSKDQRAR